MVLVLFLKLLVLVLRHVVLVSKLLVLVLRHMVLVLVLKLLVLVLRHMVLVLVSKLLVLVLRHMVLVLKLLVLVLRHVVLVSKLLVLVLRHVVFVVISKLLVVVLVSVLTYVVLVLEKNLVYITRCKSKYSLPNDKSFSFGRVLLFQSFLYTFFGLVDSFEASSVPVNSQLFQFMNFGLQFQPSVIHIRFHWVLKTAISNQIKLYLLTEPCFVVKTASQRLRSGYD